MSSRAKGMTFEPRSVVAAPAAFGRVRNLLPPAEGVDEQDHRYRSAMVQHLIATMVHDSLLLRGVTLPQFLAAGPELPGLSPDRQRRVLRGETAAQFADLAYWSSAFPAVVWITSAYIDSWVRAPSETEFLRYPKWKRPGASE